jgi:hypothetical protein
MLIYNHYFSPDTKPEVISHNFHHLENTLDTNNARVILLGDFNASGFNWESGTHLHKCHYYSNLKGDAINTSTCLRLRQYVEAVDSLNLLEIVFTNIADLKSVPADYRKHRSGSIQLNVDSTHLVEPCAVADVFPNYFQSVYNNNCSMDFPPVSQSSEFVSLAPISDADVCKAIKKLKPSKSGHDDQYPWLYHERLFGYFYSCS